MNRGGLAPDFHFGRVRRPGSESHHPEKIDSARRGHFLGVGLDGGTLGGFPALQEPTGAGSFEMRPPASIPTRLG
jgi:hypothetical protein